MPNRIIKSSYTKYNNIKREPEELVMEQSFAPPLVPGRKLMTTSGMRRAKRKEVPVRG